MKQDYKDFDDLGLCDSVIESLEINHKTRTLSFKLLKVVGTLIRNEGRNFTYKVKPGILVLHGIVFSNFSYGLEWGEWSEFYRSAILDSSNLIDRYKDKTTEPLKHIYIGIDNGNEYKEFEIICSRYEMILEQEEYILHDDFEWLYED